LKPESLSDFLHFGHVSIFTGAANFNTNVGVEVGWSVSDLAGYGPHASQNKGKY
jgi:hypothetical protein